MVKYVPDRTGRFSQRPHYEPKELDRECETIIAGFLKERHGAAKYPVSTDDLTVLIERDTESLDQFADLSGYGRNVEGLTHFQRLPFPGRRTGRTACARHSPMNTDMSGSTPICGIWSLRARTC